MSLWKKASAKYLNINLYKHLNVLYQLKYCYLNDLFMVTIILLSYTLPKMSLQVGIDTGKLSDQNEGNSKYNKKQPG